LPLSFFFLFVSFSFLFRFFFVSFSFLVLHFKNFLVGVQQDLSFAADSTHEWEELRQEIAINLDAPIHLSKLFIPHLSKVVCSPIPYSPSIGQNLFLFRQTCTYTRTLGATFLVYYATKSAVHSFSISLHHQNFTFNTFLFPFCSGKNGVFDDSLLHPRIRT
jgi:hypothetical protein